MNRAWLLTLCLVLAGAGCGDDLQYADPPSEAAGAPGAGPGRGMGGMGAGRIDPHGTVDGAAPVDPFADPHAAGQPAMESVGSAVPPGTIHYAGTVKLDPSVQLPPTYAVFLIAGLASGEGRYAPVLVKRLERAAFPLDFQLLESDRMGMGSAAVDESLFVGAILSEGGSVTPSTGLFLRKYLEQASTPGTRDLEIVLRPE